jgi:hypothetical protein
MPANKDIGTQEEWAARKNAEKAANDSRYASRLAAIEDI